MLLLARDWLWKAAWTVAILTTIYAIFLTGSRGGFLTLIVTGAVGVWKFGIQRRKYLVLLVSVVAGIVFWLSSASLLSERLKGTFDEKGADNAEAYTSWQYRQKYFWTSIEVTRQHPFFGVGPGNFQQLSGDWHETHNSFTQMSSEGGLPALVLYVAILWCGFKNLWAARRFAESSRRVRILTDAIHISLVGYVIGSAFLSVAYQLFPYFLVAYTTALVSVGRRSYLKARAKKTAGEPEYPHTVFSPALSQFGPTS
jgi:O-antigen ligase